MEASGSHQQKEKEHLFYRPYAFKKMEGLVQEMQDTENGVPVRSQKQFLTSIPSAFMGYDLIEWLMERLGIEESAEAVHLANQLCMYGYFFPVNDSKTLTVKDDSSLYRFQTPYFWPWQHKTPDNVEYAIYLAKRTLRNKQRHALEDYEIESLNNLRKNLQNKWDIIQLQAEEQVRISKERKKGDKIVSDSQERAFWRVYRPPPGCLSSLEPVPVPIRARPGLPRAPPRKRTHTDLQREVELLRNSLTRTRIKVSVAIENLKSYFETYMEYDPMIAQPQPSNPWLTDDQTFWHLSSPLVEVPTEKRVKKWAISLEEVMSDPTGLQEFTNYLRKEYSHENIRFWLAVKVLKHSNQAHMPDKVNEIFREFLAPGAPCEINIDGKTMEKVHSEMKSISRFTFDAAAEHVYNLLLKKDCYPRFIRSDQYRNILAAGVQPLQKKRFFGFVGPGKKKILSTTTPAPGNSQLQHGDMSYTEISGRRRGSDRSLSGSAHELAVYGVREVAEVSHIPHSHSQSNLTDIPYRDPSIAETITLPVDDVCPWETSIEVVSETTPEIVAPAATAATSAAEAALSETNLGPSQFSRKNSAQMDSGSSSSDISTAITEVSERLRKSYAGQQHDKAGIMRNFSMGSMVRRVKLSDVSRASMSSCNYTLPNQSFDLPCEIENKSNVALKAKEQVTKICEERLSLTKELGRAPLISINAIVGDLAEETLEHEKSCSGEEQLEVAESNDRAIINPEVPAKNDDSISVVHSTALNEPVSEEGADEAQVVPVWEPDSRQYEAAEASTAPPQEQRDNNVNEVCPWEDEENCKVDAPYVKTYATLGYL